MFGAPDMPERSRGNLPCGCDPFGKEKCLMHHLEDLYNNPLSAFKNAKEEEVEVEVEIEVEEETQETEYQPRKRYESRRLPFDQVEKVATVHMILSVEELSVLVDILGQLPTELELYTLYNKFKEKLERVI